MRSLSSQPPSKPLPKDQLPSESTKSDKPGSSSSHHPAVAPSPATPTLEELMSQEGVPDNDTLLAALNAAPPQEQCPWLKAAVECFVNQPIETLRLGSIRDYAALVHVQVTPANKQLLKSYFDSLCDKVKGGSLGEELLIQALVYVLANIDPAIFAGNPQSLLGLGDNLLEKLNPSQRDFKQADYPSARASIEALFQALFLAKEVAPRYLNLQEGSLYQSFRSRLKEIIDRAQYYPTIYHARLIKQTLQLLEGPQIDWEGNFRRVLQGLLGATNLVVVAQRLARLELKPAQFQAGIDLIQKAFRGQRIQPEPWYSQLLTLEEAMLRCLKEGALRAYPEPEELVQRAKNIPAQCRKLERLAAFFGDDTIKQYRQALRFRIVMQLQILSLEGPNDELRTGSIKRIIALARPEAWGSNKDVMFGLLDTLALIAVQSHSSRSAEATRALRALEDLCAPNPPKMPPRGPLARG